MYEYYLITKKIHYSVCLSLLNIFWHRSICVCVTCIHFCSAYLHEHSTHHNANGMQHGNWKVRVVVFNFESKKYEKVYLLISYNITCGFHIFGTHFRCMLCSIDAEFLWIEAHEQVLAHRGNVIWICKHVCICSIELWNMY